MRILVCGGRDFTDLPLLNETLYRICHVYYPYEITIIQGDARGADTLAAGWAACHGVACEEYKADWERYGKAAGHIRNQQMLVEGKPDLVIAFPGGRGTADMVYRARKAGVEVIEIGKA